MKKQSFSLLEVVLACTVLILFLSAGLIMIVGAGRSTVTSRHRTQAIYLANQAIENQRILRDDKYFATPISFHSFSNGTTTTSQNLDNIDYSIATNISDGPFGAASSKKFSVTVSWTDFNQSKNVTLYTYLTNWQT